MSIVKEQGRLTSPASPLLSNHSGKKSEFSASSLSEFERASDAETGLHQYHDASVVPEPSTWDLVGLGALALLPTNRRGKFPPPTASSPEVTRL